MSVHSVAAHTASPPPPATSHVKHTQNNTPSHKPQADQGSTHKVDIKA